MSITKNLTVLLALSLGTIVTGCAADSVDAGDDGGGGGGGGSGGDEGGGSATPTDASGKYSMRSTFDLVTNAPGTIGGITNAIVAATDDPDDPANWLLQQMATTVGGTAGNLINGSRPLVAGYLNDKLLEFAPDFVDTMIQVGQDFGQVAKNFSTNEQLEIVKGAGPDGASYTATKTVLGAHFKIDNIESDHAFADYGMQNIVVNSIGVSLDTTGKLTIAQHTLPLEYGKILHIGIDAAVIPMIDPTAHNLAELMQHKVDCAALGQLIADQYLYGFGAGALTTGCNAGLTLAAQKIYQQIDAIDGTALQLQLTGQARALDSNNDHKVDKIQTGAWTGMANYAGTPSTLGAATFYGERM
ncbi:MAG TPA: hypothetical protein VGM90_13060 [Kofleriaceae bacterium]|jgi:hypothetical protein